MSVFENDWMMRQISSMTKMLRMMFYHKASEEITAEEELKDEETKVYYHTIYQLIQEDNYAQAMNYLVEHFTDKNLEYLKTALAFFDYVNAKEDSELRAHGYSKDQLYSDLNFITKQYGIEL